MAYATGTSSTIDELLSAVINFAVANAGFTVGPNWTTTVRPYNGGQAEGVDPNYKVRSLVKSGIYYFFQFKEDYGRLYMTTATGSNGTGAIQQQPGAPTYLGGYVNHTHNSFCEPIAGPHVAYFLFAQGGMVHVAVEIVPNVFVHFSFGEAIGLGGLPDFACLMAFKSYGSYLYDHLSAYHRLPWTNSNGYEGQSYQEGQNHIRSPITGAVAGWGAGSFEGDIRRAFNPIDAAGHGLREIVQARGTGASTFNNRAPLFPVNIVESSVGHMGPYYQIGMAPGVAHVNIQNIGPKEIVNTDWMVFPISQKNGNGTTYLNTGNRGIAYKK